MRALLPVTITKLGGSLFTLKEISPESETLLDKCLGNYDDSEPVIARDTERPSLPKVSKSKGEVVQGESDV